MQAENFKPKLAKFMFVQHPSEIFFLGDCRAEEVEQALEKGYETYFKAKITDKIDVIIFEYPHTNIDFACMVFALITALNGSQKYRQIILSEKLSKGVQNEFHGCFESASEINAEIIVDDPAKYTKKNVLTISDYVVIAPAQQELREYLLGLIKLEVNSKTKTIILESNDGLWQRNIIVASLIDGLREKQKEIDLAQIKIVISPELPDDLQEKYFLDLIEHKKTLHFKLIGPIPSLKKLSINFLIRNSGLFDKDKLNILPTDILEEVNQEAEQAKVTFEKK